MLRSGWRNHLPLIRTMTLMVALLALIGWGLSSLSQGLRERGLDSSQWLWAPAASFLETAPPPQGWTPLHSEPDLHNKSRYYWLRIPLPSDTPRDPQLWMFNLVSVRVFSGGKLLYSYDPGERGQRLNLFTHWYLPPLPDPLPAQIELLVDNRGASRPAPWLKPVSKGDLYVELLRKDVFSFVLGSLFLFTSFVAAGLYGVRRDKLHLYFGLLSFCGFCSCLARNDLMQVLWDQPWIGYMDMAVFPLGVFAFVSIMNGVFPALTAALSPLKMAILAYSALTIAGALFLDPARFGWLLTYPLLLLLGITAGVIFRSLRKAYREHRGTDSVWMLSGFVIVAFFALIHVVKTYLPSQYERFAAVIPPLKEIPFDLLSVGMFLFLICLIRVIIFRFGVMNERLQHIGEFLEGNVRSRTAELQERTRQLEESSARLAESTQETAETIASSMVLEERQRITGNIHDTVGHALTASIVQLEAAKRLLDRDPKLAMDKVAATQELIRSGLEDIRQSVRLLRDDFTRYDLADAMTQLIRKTERTTEARFEVAIETLPEPMTTLQKRVLYQALQEGITNGLRHGGSSRFVFSLTVQAPVILFRLESDGNTYTRSAFGFGLKAMSERVAQLGGVMSVEPGHPGCVLLLKLPYAEPRNHVVL